MAESINSYLSKFKLIIQIRGNELYEEKRCSVVKYTDDEFLCIINGNNKDYLTTFKLEGGKIVSASCTCPYFDDGYGAPCKHLFAAVLVLRDLMKQRVKKEKEDKISDPSEGITLKNFIYIFSLSSSIILRVMITKLI